MVRFIENPSVTGGLWSSSGNECVCGDGDMVMLAGGFVGSVGTGLRVRVSPPRSRSFVGILGAEGGGGDDPAGIVPVCSPDGTD